MMNWHFLILPIMMSGSYFAIANNHKQFLMCLLSLEMLLLMLLMTMILTTTLLSYLDMSSVMLLLVMGACESSLGLSMLVLITRKNNSDSLKSAKVMSF